MALSETSEEPRNSPVSIYLSQYCLTESIEYQLNNIWGALWVAKETLHVLWALTGK